MEAALGPAYAAYLQTAHLHSQSKMPSAPVSLTAAALPGQLGSANLKRRSSYPAQLERSTQRKKLRTQQSSFAKSAVEAASAAVQDREHDTASQLPSGKVSAQMEPTKRAGGLLSAAQQSRVRCTRDDVVKASKKLGPSCCDPAIMNPQRSCKPGKTALLQGSKDLTRASACQGADTCHQQIKITTAAADCSTVQSRMNGASPLAAPGKGAMEAGFARPAPAQAMPDLEEDIAQAGAPYAENKRKAAFQGLAAPASSLGEMAGRAEEGVLDVPGEADQVPGSPQHPGANQANARSHLVLPSRKAASKATSGMQGTGYRHEAVQSLSKAGLHTTKIANLEGQQMGHAALQQLREDLRRMADPPPTVKKTTGRRFVPETLLSALGLTSLGLAPPTAGSHPPSLPTAGTPAPLPCTPTPQQRPRIFQEDLSTPTEPTKPHKRKLSDLMEAPTTPQQQEDASSVSKQTTLDNAEIDTEELDSRAERKSETGIEGSQSLRSSEGSNLRKDTPHRIPTAAVVVASDPRPSSKRLKARKVMKDLTKRARPEMAPRTRCELMGVPTYFYPSSPPQDPGKLPARRESEQDYVRVKDTASIWGKVSTRPRSGNEVRVLPVNQNFHISSITDPNFRLGNKPYKFSFPLEGPEAFEPQRIVGGNRQALRKFPEPPWLHTQS